jgi:outer membrane protein OmpA-like peptidoglycan-associated protein
LHEDDGVRVQGASAREKFMKRLALPFILLLLLLFAGAVWAVFTYIDTPPDLAGRPAQESTPSLSKASPSTDGAVRSDEGISADSSDGATFDIARIEPDGISVFAGRAEPGTNLMLLSDGDPLGTVQADDNGEWTLTTEHRFASKDPKLSLRTATAAEMRQSKATQTALAEQTEEPAAPAAKKKSAKAVTSDMLKNLEGMVEDARNEQAEAAEPQVAEPKVAEPQVAEPTVADVGGPEATASGGTKVSQPEPADPQTTEPSTTAARLAEPKVSEPSTDAPRVAAADTTGLPATDTAQDSLAAVRVAPQAQPQANAPSAGRKTVPVPITFIFNEANFTTDGRKAANLLLEYLKLKNYDSVSLTGHADERGTVGLNMNLSSERLDTVARFLRDGGFKGELDLVPKGESEPFTGVVRSEYDREELYQLDRRVELIIPR